MPPRAGPRPVPGALAGVVATVVATLVVLGAAVGLGGCSSGGNGDDTTARDAAVSSAALVAVAVPELAPSDSGATPLLYVAPASGEAISAPVQVQVVNAMKDDAEVRFVDDRADVIDDGV